MLSSVPEGAGLAVEFRHPVWFKDHCLRREAWDLLEAHGASTVITDVAGRRDVLHTSLSTPRVMIRFVGNELHPSDYTRVDEWVARLREWIEAGLEEVYFFLHHPGYENIPEISSYFAKKMNEACGLALPDCLAAETEPKGTQMGLL